MEFKDLCVLLPVLLIIILIESQWNLKPVETGKDSDKSDILIESQWNLKRYALTVLSAARLHINRITVEFKGTSDYMPAYNGVIILIESQWNLKAVLLLHGLQAMIILIESQWNLKSSHADIKNHPPDINRITVEFKVL